MSQQNSIVENCFRKRSSESGVQLRQCGRKGFGGSTMNHHENKRERLERLGQKLKTGAGTQIGVPICFTEYPQLSSLAAELWTPCWVMIYNPLLVWKVGVIGKPLEAGCDTHKKPNSARMQSSGKTDLFSKTACTLAGRALFGRRVGPVLDLMV